MTITKQSVSPFIYLYGCEAKDLPVAFDDRMEMYTVQRDKASALLSRLMEPNYKDRDHSRVNDVIKCIGWNESMIDKLKKSK